MRALPRRPSRAQQQATAFVAPVPLGGGSRPAAAGQAARRCVALPGGVPRGGNSGEPSRRLQRPAFPPPAAPASSRVTPSATAGDATPASGPGTGPWHEQLRAAGLLLSSVVEDFVGDAPGVWRRGASTVTVRCPFHDDTNPSMSVSDEMGRYRCFACGAAGDTLQFEAEARGLPSRRDALVSLAKRYPEAAGVLAASSRSRPSGGTGKRGRGIPLTPELEEAAAAAASAAAERSRAAAAATDEAAEEARRLRKGRIRIMAAAALVWADELTTGRSADAAYARTYVANERRLSAETVTAFGIGYAPDEFDYLTTYLTVDCGYDVDECVAVGLLSRSTNTGRVYDTFRHRIMVPILDADGDVVGFGGRALSPSERAPKYLNSAESALFRKRSILFNGHRVAAVLGSWAEAQAAVAAAAAGSVVDVDGNIRRMTPGDVGTIVPLGEVAPELAAPPSPPAGGGHVFIVEGYMDVLSLHQAGVATAVAAMGTALSREQLLAALKMAPPDAGVVINFDGDAAGVAAVARLCDTVLPSLPPAAADRVRVAFLPSKYKDADAFVTDSDDDYAYYVTDAALPWPLWRGLHAIEVAAAASRAATAVAAAAPSPQPPEAAAEAGSPPPSPAAPKADLIYEALLVELAGILHALPPIVPLASRAAISYGLRPLDGDGSGRDGRRHRGAPPPSTRREAFPRFTGRQRDYASRFASRLSRTTQEAHMGVVQRLLELVVDARNADLVAAADAAAAAAAAAAADSSAGGSGRLDANGNRRAATGGGSRRWTAPAGSGTNASFLYAAIEHGRLVDKLRPYNEKVAAQSSRGEGRKVSEAVLKSGNPNADIFTRYMAGVPRGPLNAVLASEARLWGMMRSAGARLVGPPGPSDEDDPTASYGARVLWRLTRRRILEEEELLRLALHAAPRHRASILRLGLAAQVELERVGCYFWSTDARDALWGVLTHRAQGDSLSTLRHTLWETEGPAVAAAVDHLFRDPTDAASYLPDPSVGYGGVGGNGGDDGAVAVTAVHEDVARQYAELVQARFKAPVKHAAGCVELVVSAERQAAATAAIAAARARYDVASTAARAVANRPDAPPAEVAAAEKAVFDAAQGVLDATSEVARLREAGVLKKIGLDPALLDLYRETFADDL
ncbi:hypothetical protein MMPV_003095 [Pyropia vietnamensis]